MTNENSFDDSTFNALKHYVGVRLQQGVPIVHYDENEREDIRRFELQAFLKWFVGNGVPAGNDGFKIEPMPQHALILTAQANMIEFDLEKSTAAKPLLINQTNYHAAKFAPPYPQIIIDHSSSDLGRGDLNNTKLVFKTRDSVKDEWLEEEIELSEAGINNTPGQLEYCTILINNHTERLHAEFDAAGKRNLIIKGANGTPAGVGRCLVEGWEAINECALVYTNQPLYDNKELAKTWGVEELELLPELDEGQTTSAIAYLDVWERLVTDGEDEDLKNNTIGLGPTCWRIKRDWVVRCEVGKDAPPVPGELPTTAGHAYYPLARVTWTGTNVSTSITEVVDLRNTIANLAQMATDTYGANNVPTRRPQLDMSLREAINHLLLGTAPVTEPELVENLGTSSITGGRICTSIVDQQGKIWLFMVFEQSVIYCNFDRIPGANSLRQSSVYKWSVPHSSLSPHDSSWQPLAIADPRGRYLWLFWNREHNQEKELCGARFHANEAGKLSMLDQPFTLGPAQSEGRPVACIDSDENIWIAWSTTAEGIGNAYYAKLKGLDDSHELIFQGTSGFEGNGPGQIKITVSHDEIWIFAIAQDDNYERHLYSGRLSGSDEPVWKIGPTLGSDVSSFAVTTGKDPEQVVIWHEEGSLHFSPIETGFGNSAPVIISPTGYSIPTQGTLLSATYTAFTEFVDGYSWFKSQTSHHSLIHVFWSVGTANYYQTIHHISRGKYGTKYGTIGSMTLLPPPKAVLNGYGNNVLNEIVSDEQGNLWLWFAPYSAAGGIGDDDCENEIWYYRLLTSI